MRNYTIFFFLSFETLYKAALRSSKAYPDSLEKQINYFYKKPLPLLPSAIQGKLNHKTTTNILKEQRYPLLKGRSHHRICLFLQPITLLQMI